MNKHLTLLLSAALLTSACQSTASDSQSVDAPDAVASYDGTGVEPPQELLLESGRTIGDIRFPVGLEVNAKKSIILGAGESSYGKIVASIRTDSELLVKFFRDHMPNEGWTLISEFQADDTTLTYDKPNRVAVLLIERSSRSTTVRITVTPRSS